MNPIEPVLFPGSHLIVFAKDQPQYRSLPAAVGEQGTVVTEWEFTADELKLILEGARFRLTIFFVDLSKPFTPILPEIIK